MSAVIGQRTRPRGIYFRRSANGRRCIEGRMPRRACALVGRKAEYSRESLLLHHLYSSRGTGDSGLGNPPSASRVRNGHEDRGHNTHLARDAGDNPVTFPQERAGDITRTLSVMRGTILLPCRRPLNKYIFVTVPCWTIAVSIIPLTELIRKYISVTVPCWTIAMSGRVVASPLLKHIGSPWTFGY